MNEEDVQKRLWELLSVNDQIFHSRVSFWIAAELVGIALVGGATISTGNKSSLTVVAIAGLLMTLLWWKTGYNLSSKLAWAHRQLRGRDQIYRDFIVAHATSDLPAATEIKDAQTPTSTNAGWWTKVTSSRNIFTHALPLLFTLAWISLVVLMFSV